MKLFVHEDGVQEIFIKWNRILVYNALSISPKNFLKVKRNSKMKDIRE